MKRNFIKYFVFTIVLSSIVSVDMIYGQTGQLAYAYPLENIKIDGQLNDWPINLKTYEISSINGELWGDKPESIHDLESNFMIGYNEKENAIYIAIRVRDNSQIFNDSENSDFNTHDGTEIYIDEIHDSKGSSVISHGVYGERRVSFGYASDTKSANYAYQKFDKEYIHEWKINLSREIQSGMSLGIDIGVFDKDEDGSFSYIAWGKETAKVNSFNRLGDIILSTKNTEFGYLHGKVNKIIGTDGIFPNSITIRSANDEKLWTQTLIDSNGHYKIKLPIDDYKIYASSNSNLKLKDEKIILATVKANKIITCQDLTPEIKLKPEYKSKKGILKSNGKIDYTNLDSLITELMEYYDIPGMSIAIIKDFKIDHSKTFGVKMVGYEEEIDEKTLFEAASLTKPMFSYLVNRLADKGIIDIDKPLYQYLPFKDIEHDERYKLITARIVLSHGTGFPNWRSENKDRKLDIKFTPGTSYGYSGEGFEYLKKVVCHITDSTIETLFQKEVFDVFGIENAQITWSSEESELRTAIPHTDGRTPIPKRIWNNPLVAASLHINAKNYGKFMVGLMQGKGLSKSRYMDMMTIQNRPSVDSEDSPVGLGIFIMETPSGNKYYGHGGANHGFTSNAVFFKDDGNGYIFLVNNQNAAKVDKELFSILIKEN